MKIRLCQVITLLTVVLLLLGGCTAQKKKDISLTVSAAASLNGPLQEIGELYKKEKTGVEVLYNFGASGALQQQIEQGAPADLFISAAPQQMNTLQQKGLLIEESRRDLLQNSIVLIAPQGASLKGFTELSAAKVSKIAIGAPESVPAGKYAKEILTNMGLWEKIAPKVIEAKDVRQVLSYVESGNVDAGLVYRTDAAGKSPAIIVAEAPATTYTPVVYPMAVLKSSPNRQAAEEFAKFLSSEQAGQVFRKYGFIFLGK